MSNFWVMLTVNYQNPAEYKHHYIGYNKVESTGKMGFLKYNLHK